MNYELVLENLCNKLIYQTKKQLTRFQLYGNYHNSYSSYKIDEIQQTLGCKGNFIFNQTYTNSFNLELYKYDVLYSTEHNINNFRLNAREDPIGKAYIKYTILLNIFDKDNNSWYMYIKRKFISECASCDGNTKNVINRMFYSHDLKKLIEFIYTPKEIKTIFENISL